LFFKARTHDGSSFPLFIASLFLPFVIFAPFAPPLLTVELGKVSIGLALSRLEINAFDEVTKLVSIIS
jgi:hypothetical protein